MIERSELPIAFGAKPALAIVATPVANTAPNISDRIIVFLSCSLAAPHPKSKPVGDEPPLNALGRAEFAQPHRGLERSARRRASAHLAGGCGADPEPFERNNARTFAFVLRPTCATSLAARRVALFS
jgi:hypothetical protein